mmetsp:Transcript_137860/g.384400  ORF Transcript_137860/g.384400 Transcript_137860/m.384400 type:complete len:95 (+) Transcript_137860:51-335(+)
MFQVQHQSDGDLHMQHQLQKLMAMHEQTLRENGEFRRQNQELMLKNQELMSTVIEQDKRIARMERTLTAYQDEAYPSTRSARRADATPCCLCRG